MSFFSPILYYKFLFFLKNLRRQPLLHPSADLRCLFVPAFLGIGIAIYFTLPIEPPLWWGGALTCAGLAGVYFFRQTSRYQIFLVFCLVFIGFTAISFRVNLIGDILLKQPINSIEIQGTITKSDLIEGGFSRVTLANITSPDLPATSQLQNVRIRLPHGSYQAGDLVSTRAQLFPPSAPSVVGGFDFQRYAYFHGLSATGYSTGSVTVTPSDSYFLDRLRYLIHTRIEKVLSGDTAAIAGALMIGERDAISTPTEDAMRQSGLYHILSISGLHMAMVGGLIFYSLRYLFCCFPYIVLRYPVKKLAAFFTIWGMGFYMILAGATLPTQRAFAMASLVMIGIMLDRTIISFRSLAIVATFLLLIWPESLIDISFQLSFAATFALVALYQGLAHLKWYQQPTSNIAGRSIRHVLLLLLSSCAAVIITAVFTIFHFHQLNLYGPIANLLGVPLTGLWIMPTGLIACLLIPLGIDDFFWQLMGYGIDGLMIIAQFVSHWPWAAISVAQLPVFSFVSIVISLLLGFLLFRWWKSLALIPFCMGIIYFTYHQPPDLLIRGSQIALYTGDQLVTLGKPHPFTLEQWQGLYGKIPVLQSTSSQVASWLDCQKSFCSWSSSAFKIALDTGYKPHTTTESSDLWIAPRYKLATKDLSAKKTIDKEQLEKQGVHAIWLNDNDIRIKTDLDYRGERPWVIQKNLGGTKENDK